MKRHDKHFIYRIPLPWLEAVMTLDNQSRGQTKLLNLALAIWYLYGLKREIRISTRIRETFHISHSALYRNIRVLKDSGLITVSSKKGAAPVIKIVREEVLVPTERVLREERMEG
jgi:hypothetical protein